MEVKALYITTPKNESTTAAKRQHATMQKYRSHKSDNNTFNIYLDIKQGHF